MNVKSRSILDGYKPERITIGTICSHSALQILYGARVEGFKTVGLTKPDRKPIYDSYPAATPDKYINVKDWSELLDDRIQQQLIEENTILIPHGSFVEYVGISNIMNKLHVPILGNRKTLEWEADRTKQRQWLEKAGVRLPREYSSILALAKD